jgi:ABC-2 type transport system ATP-binding protein
LVQAGAAVLLTTHYIEEAEALAHQVVVLMRGRVLTQGSVDDLRRQHHKRQIRCISGLSVDEVRAWPGVSAATRQNEWLEIEAPAAEGIVRKLLAADAVLSELEVQRAGLSEAFVTLTQGNQS